MNKQNIYNILFEGLKNPYAVYGIMGNLQRESALYSNNLQNSGNSKLDMTDAEYTLAVDNGTYTNFIRDCHGYGLAQWTYWSRKQMLLEFARAKGVSIGDESMQCEFIIYELQKNYKPLYAKLLTVTTIKEASDLFCTGYERPADQSVNALAKRHMSGEQLYAELNSNLTESEFLKELDVLLNKYGYVKK